MAMQRVAIFLAAKGANLAEMSGIGLPVPPGFTLSTDVCTHFYDHDKTYPDTLDQQVRDAIAKIESETGTLFAILLTRFLSRFGRVRVPRCRA
jgi:phosphoenolpyruvate synthase/pyruvate phosphate dikinase